MKRGQAALEFITTYGWAILIIMVMIGAIAYFGVLNPSKLLPARCTTTSELSCEDYQLSSGATDTVKVQFKQAVGKTIYYQGATCAYLATSSPSYPSTVTAKDVSITGSPTITAGSSWSPTHKIELNCDFGAGNFLSTHKGQKVKVSYYLNYSTSTSGFVHNVEGEVFAEVQ